MADRLVVTKTDIPEGRTALAALSDALGALNPGAPVLEAAAGEADAQALLDCGLYNPRTKHPDVARWLGEEARLASATDKDHHHAHDVNRHGSTIRAFAVETGRLMPVAAFEGFLDMLQTLHGPRLLRIKGIVGIDEFPETPVVIHGVQHVFHPPARLNGWPDGDRRTRIVFITDGLSEQVVRRLFASLSGDVAIDTPDRAAVLDNPLAIPGGPGSAGR